MTSFTLRPVPGHEDLREPVCADGPTLLDTATIIERIDALLDLVDHAARRRLDAHARVSLMKRSRTLGRRVAGLEATLLAEVSQANATDAALGTPLASVLVADGHATQAEATSEIFTADDVAVHQVVRDATLAGTLTMRQARAAAQAVEELPVGLTQEQRADAEELLVERSARRSARQIPALVPEVLAAVAPESAPSVEDELTALDAQTRRAYARRSLRLTPDGDGALTIRGSLPLVPGRALQTLLSSFVESDRRSGRGGAADRLDPHQAERTPEQRLADALSFWVDLTLATKQAPTVAGDRPRVVVHIREGDLRDRAEQAGLLASGESITSGELRRLCCDADLTPITSSSDGVVLDVGRTHRLVTPDIRLALADRDGRCQFPGCQAPNHRCEAHHIEPWWAGGTTALHNLVLLCPYHHGLVEPPRFWSGPPPDRWEVRASAAGPPEFLPPRRMDSERKPIPAQPCVPARRSWRPT